MGTSVAGTLNTLGLQENLQFSIEIAVYLGNGTTQATGCYGSLMGSRR